MTYALRTTVRKSYVDVRKDVPGTTVGEAEALSVCKLQRRVRASQATARDGSQHYDNMERVAIWHIYSTGLRLHVHPLSSATQETA